LREGGRCSVEEEEGREGETEMDVERWRKCEREGENE
jgi:hypothetical protein